MLETFRNATKSWIVRGLLLVVASTFALYFGSGATMFSSLANQPVAKVGSIEISQTQFAEAYRARYVELRGQLTPDQARQFGLPYAVLTDMIGAALLDNAAHDLGIAVSDAILAAQIRSQIGTMDEATYQQVLRQQGITARQFEGNMRRDLTRQQLAAAVVSTPPIPKVMADTLYRYREQRRVAEYVTIPPVAPDAIAEPDAAALTAYYDVNQRRYAAPEYRDITYIAMRPADVMDSIRVRDEELAAEYARRRSEFTQPETREVSQLYFTTEAEARAGKERIDRGVAFNDADKADAVPADPMAPPRLTLNAGQTDPNSLGTLRQDELPGEVAAAVFALPGGGVSEPLRTTFGWHLYKVNKVNAGSARSLDEVRNLLRVDLAQEQALTELYNLSVTLDDALAGGATLEEGAQKVGLPAQKATIDSTGRTRDGGVAAIPLLRQFLPTVVATPEGRESRLVEATEGGYFVIRVDAITPPTTLAYDAVKDRVRADWLTEERRKRTDEAAQAFLDKAKAGELAAVAAADNVAVDTTLPFTRNGLGLGTAFPAQLVGQMFANEVGGYALAPHASGSTIVARLKEIIAANPVSAIEAVEKIRTDVQGDVTEEMLAAYQEALRTTYGIQLNDRAFEQAMTLAQQSLPTFPAR